MSCFVSSYSFLEPAFYGPTFSEQPQHNFSFTPILSQDLISRTDKWQFPKNALDCEKFHISLKSNQLPFQPWRTAKTSLSHDDIGMSADEQFLPPVRPSPPTQFVSNDSKKKQKASDVVSLSISSVISKFMLCIHLKVTTCKSTLYRLTLPHLQERGRWETKQFMGMALSAPQTPPAKTKNEQNILYRSWDPFLINSFCH